MTEDDWQTSTDPMAMLRFLADKASQRQRRLFACACCRRVWHLLTYDESRYAVELAERSADEPISERELDLVSGEAEWAWEEICTEGLPENDPRPSAASAASYGSSPGVLEIDPHLLVVVEEAASALGVARESALQANLLREIVGNPFRSLALDPAWLAWNGGTVQKLAEAAYQERSLPEGTLDLARLAVLADALEDAGCTDTELLSHLHGPGPHVRGCWVLDLLLGKQ
jgi:hypothetical protein